MAITVTAQITGQEVTTFTSYGYLYEPLKVNISDSNSLATKIYIDLIVRTTDDATTIDSIIKYGDFDLSTDGTLEIDIMRMIEQYHDANVFEVGVVSDISSGDDMIISKNKYFFQFYSDVSAANATYSKLPILGGRDFYDFVPAVSVSQDLTEAESYGVDLTGRWLNYPNISTSLANPIDLDSTPTTTITTEAVAEFEPCGGMLIWKSRYGGWMYWGMDIATRSGRGSYSGNLAVGMFEATPGGNPYVQADYSKIDSTYSLSLKALTLTNDELEAVSGIVNSVAVYYMRNSTAKLELMRVSSATAPISTLIGGGDFSVSLNSISTSSQKAR